MENLQYQGKTAKPLYHILTIYNTEGGVRETTVNVKELLLKMKESLQNEETILETRTNKDVNKTYIWVNGIVITTVGVYRRAIVICVKDSAIIDGQTYYLPELVSSEVGVKTVSEERLKKIIDKAVKVKNYGDFQELVKLVKHSRDIKIPDKPKLKSAKCLRSYDILANPPPLSPEVFGWKE